MTDTHYPPYWRERLLAVVGAPQRAQSARFLAAWAQAEGGSAKWNPLNTTYHLHNSTDYNSAGVQNYARPTEGVCVTALALVGGYYPKLLGHLQAGTYTAEQITIDCADQIKIWGTDPALILEVLRTTPA